MKKRNKKKIFIFFFLLIICIVVIGICVNKLNNGEEKNKEKNEVELTEKEEVIEEENEVLNQEKITIKKMTSEELLAYGRNQKRYTDKEIFYKTGAQMVQIENKDFIKDIGCEPLIMKEYLTAFVSKHRLEVSLYKVLNFCYVETEDERKRLYIFGEFNDENNTLVTVIFEPATSEQSAYYDVVPCQYSYEEILNEAWYEKEEQ